MPLATRRSRRVAGLSPSATLPSAASAVAGPVAAPAPVAATPIANRTGFRKTAARSISHTPLASASKKRRANRLSDDSNEANFDHHKNDNGTTPKKRPCLAADFNAAETPEAQLFRELAALSPVRLNNFSVSKAISCWKDQNKDKPLPDVASIQRFLDEHNTTPAAPSTKMAVQANFSSTFRLDYDAFSSDDEDEIMPAPEQATMRTTSKAPIIITNLEGTFRAPGPDDSDSGSDDSTDDDEVALPHKASTTPKTNDVADIRYDNILDSTPCPKAGAKKFSRSRSSSLNNTTSAPQSIFDHGHTTSTTENATSVGDASITDTSAQADADTHTANSIPQITQFPPRTTVPRTIARPLGRRDHPLGKTIMTANLFDYVEGHGINIAAPINQQTIDDFNARAQSSYTPGMESHRLHGLESEIAQWADIGIYDHKSIEWVGKISFDEEFMEFTKNIKTKLDGTVATEDDNDMGLELVVDDVIDMDHEGKTKEDFALENLRASSLAAIVDAIPEEEFMAMDEEL